MISPDLPEFLAQALPGVLSPVWSDLVADLETPLSAYWKLAHGEPFSFLLESVTGGEQLARYSILGTRPRQFVSCRDGQLRVRYEGGETVGEMPAGDDPLDVLERHTRPAQRLPGLPKFTGGAVGYLAYDLVRHFERLPDAPPDDLNLPDMAMMIAETVVVFDHAKNLIRIIANTPGTAEGYVAACAEIERIRVLLQQPLPELPSMTGQVHEVTSNIGRSDFEDGVRRIKEYIAAGDGIQMVLSQRFETRVDAHPLSVYRALRSLNPSPYMFLLRMGEVDVVGASPEILVSLNEGVARVRPIAGTRWRGQTDEEDRALEAELLDDVKEQAEHIMLVDLGRNDLGRVCETGTVQVSELMRVERYSHVMHIVSDVTGRLAPGRNAFDLVRATFPAGTVSGAPKVRAMQIIDELEPTRRGLYAGAVGYVGNDGNSDLCIAIRTVLMKHGKAYVQAGAGIVYDSDPAKEFDETVNKARACLKAIEIAQTGW